jgi:hypothetical protein
MQPAGAVGRLRQAGIESASGDPGRMFEDTAEAVDEGLAGHRARSLVSIVAHGLALRSTAVSAARAEHI